MLSRYCSNIKKKLYTFYKHAFRHSRPSRVERTGHRPLDPERTGKLLRGGTVLRDRQLARQAGQQRAEGSFKVLRTEVSAHKSHNALIALTDNEP